MPSRHVYGARWVLPIAGPPLRDAFVATDGGRIEACGAGVPAGAVDLGQRAILPALVNAHTHLELSHLHARIPPAERFTDWVRALLDLRRTPSLPGEVEAAADAALHRARLGGTGLFGDVSNTLVTVPLLLKHGVTARVFHELLGFNVPEPAALVAEARGRADAATTGAVHVSLAAHAPYSVSPALFDAIKADIRSHGEVSSVHLAESPEEVRFLRDGSGPWRDILQALGAWTGEWRAPGLSPVAYLLDLGFLDPSVLLVHGVQCTRDDLARLAAAGVTVVSCPRSNAYVGVGAPPLDAFYEAGIPVALGTDSLASVGDLDMFSELAEARRVAPRVAAARLLDSATRQGARALGFAHSHGTVEVGKQAALISVRVPAGVTDVEEYLVSGIPSDDVSWLGDDGGPPRS